MLIKLKRSLRTGEHRYRRTDTGIEMPEITEFPTDKLPSDAEAFVDGKWVVNYTDKAGKVEKELTKAIPAGSTAESIKMTAQLQALADENKKLKDQLASKKSDEKKDAPKL